jgi:GNAT superfamily N-acetyltransferase
MELLMQVTNGIKYAREDLYEVKDEAAHLLEKHWEEIALNKEKIKLNPDWNAYDAMYKSGQLGIYTARKNGKLIGYFVVVATPSLHYKDHLFAVNDIIYLDPEHRKGFVGIKLIKFAEEDLKKFGVSVFTINIYRRIKWVLLQPLPQLLALSRLLKPQNNKRKLLQLLLGNSRYRQNDHSVKLFVRHRFFVHRHKLRQVPLE